jgi:hypothetical protein
LSQKSLFRAQGTKAQKSQKHLTDSRDDRRRWKIEKVLTKTAGASPPRCASERRGKAKTRSQQRDARPLWKIEKVLTKTAAA